MTRSKNLRYNRIHAVLSGMDNISCWTLNPRCHNYILDSPLVRKPEFPFQAVMLINDMKMQSQKKSSATTIITYLDLNSFCNKKHEKIFIIPNILITTDRQTNRACNVKIFFLKFSLRKTHCCFSNKIISEHERKRTNSELGLREQSQRFSPLNSQPLLLVSLD